MRTAALRRATAETDITLELSLDGVAGLGPATPWGSTRGDEERPQGAGGPPSFMSAGGEARIATGLAYFDHMLMQLAKHGGFGIQLDAKGDLEVDSHHLVEDVGLALGDALREALGERRGIARWGEAHVPMDETLARVVVDLSGRPYCVFDADLPRIVLGNGFQVEMVREFFIALAMRAQMNLHASILYGQNTHHQVEALFKGLARALKQAVRVEGGGVPSTKGTLTS